MKSKPRNATPNPSTVLPESPMNIVRNYLFRIFDKLGVSTRVELVLYCLQDRPARPVQMAS